MASFLHPKIRIGIVSAVLVLLAVVMLAYRAVSSFYAANGWVLHTQEVRLEVAQMLSAMKDAETGTRGFLLTGDESFGKSFDSDVHAARQHLDVLRRLTADNPGQQARLDALQPLIAEKVEHMRHLAEMHRTVSAEAAAAEVATARGKNMMDQIRNITASMAEQESALLEARLASARGATRRTVIFLITALLIDFLLVGLVVATLRREFRTSAKAAAEILSLYNGAPCGYFSIDPDGVIVAMNDTGLFWLGYTREEVVGRMEVSTLLSASDRERFASDFEALRERGSVSERELELVRRSGATLPVLYNATVERDGQGGFVTARITVFDMTERKQVERVSAQARVYAESIVETMREPLLILTHELRVNSANRAFYEMFHLIPAEVEGREFRELIGGQFAVPKLVQILEDIVPGDAQVDDFELAVNLPKVGKKQLRLSARKLHRPGNHTTMMLLSIEDVTVRQQVEHMHRQFRSLFESVPGLYLVLTPDFTIVAASDAYLKATMTRREQITGRGLFEVFPDNPSDPAANGTANLRASLQRALQTGVPDTMAIQKYDVRGPDGKFTERFWSPVNSPVVGADGQIEYLIHRVEDVTDFVRQRHDDKVEAGGMRARLEKMEAEIFQRAQEAHAATAQLRLINEELEAFSYSVSHDLRAPLRHIEGYTGMLEKHVEASLDEKGRRYLKTISASACRMGTLIDDLLDFSRVGRVELRRRQVNLGSLVEEVRQALLPEINGREVEWEIAPLPVVHGDPGLLRQVLVNLLANAIKYSRKRAQARIEIGTMAGAPGEIVVFVRDNGAGFDMKYASKLFGVFQRLHSAAEFDGTGVGLANVRRIVTRHGGRVWAEGRVGEGATFYFALPVATATAVNPDNSPPNT